MSSWAILLVSCVHADTIGRVLTRHPDRTLRTAEYTLTNAGRSSPERSQGRLQRAVVSGLQLEWAQDVEVKRRKLKVAATYHHTNEGHGVQEVRLSSGVLDLPGGLSLSSECSHDFDRQKSVADVMLIEPRGTIVAVACDAPGGISEVGVFRRAGPVNLQPRWLTKAKLLRLHVGRGSAFRRCPVSMQLDVPLAGGIPTFELKLRRKLGLGRQLRAVWLATQSNLLLELVDEATDKGGVWVARARAPCRLGNLQAFRHEMELTLRRKWRW